MKKMKKKLVCTALVFTLMVSFGACNESNTSGNASLSPTATEGSPAFAGNTPGQSGGITDDWVKLDLVYATYLPANNPVLGHMDTLSEKLEKYMPGMITVTVFPNSTLLGQSDIYDGVLTGSCDIGWVDMGTVSQRFPLTQIFGYPSMRFNGATVASQALMEWIETEKPAEYDDVIVLHSQSNGPPCFFTKRKITSINDLKGMQLRASSLLAKTAAVLGATPVSMETGEVYEAVRSGLLDGMFHGFGSASLINLDEVADYALMSPLGSPVSVCVMNKDVFNKMPASQQEAFMAACQEEMAENKLYAEEVNASNQRIIDCANNVNFRFLEGDLYEEFRNASSSLLDDYIKTLDEQGLNGVYHLNKIKELADKYNESFTWEDYKSYYPPASE
jgi:TRAP-type C4-dicarboxylate transport system substrate-binding protein